MTRGIIEGFYGRPWSPADRREVLGFCAERGMDAYVYAPKDDLLHRHEWRTPYAPSARAEFASLARHCESIGMAFGFALSPGLDLDFAAPADRQAVLAKLLAALEDGAGWLVLAFDDLPGAVGEADGARQADFVASTAEAIWLRAPDVRVSMVPTQYVGMVASPYLATLAAGLPRSVDIAWTGPWVVSPVLAASDARARANTVDGRPPLVWDNYPVNDGGMARSLFLGPYAGREPGLADEVAGVLCNPMPHAQASCVALATAADFLRDPAGYDPPASWARAIAEVGGPGLDVLAEACADSALAPARGTRLHRLVDALEAGDDDAAQEIAAVLRAARDADNPLGAETAPWVEQLRLDARAGLRALDLLAATGPEQAAAAAWALGASWHRSRTAGPGVNVFGPRFAVYPMAGAGPDGNWRVDLARSVVEDQSAIDRLCRLAIARAV